MAQFNLLSCSFDIAHDAVAVIPMAGSPKIVLDVEFVLFQRPEADLLVAIAKQIEATVSFKLLVVACVQLRNEN